MIGPGQGEVYTRPVQNVTAHHGDKWYQVNPRNTLCKFTISKGVALWEQRDAVGRPEMGDGPRACQKCCSHTEVCVSLTQMAIGTESLRGDLARDTIHAGKGEMSSVISGFTFCVNLIAYWRSTDGS